MHRRLTRGIALTQKNPGACAHRVFASERMMDYLPAAVLLEAGSVVLLLDFFDLCVLWVVEDL